MVGSFPQPEWLIHRDALLTGGVIIAKGDVEEGKRVLATVDDSKVTEPAAFLNVGITLLNKNKPKDALTFFDKTVNSEGP